MKKASPTDKNVRKKITVIALTALAAVLLVAFASVTILRRLGNDVSDYEIVSKLAEDRNELIKLAKKHLDGVLSPYENKEKAYEKVEETINTAVAVVSEEDGVYTVRLNGTPSFTAEVREGSLGKTAELTSFLIWNENTVVEAPKGASVTLNGKTLKGGRDVPYRLVSEYEVPGENSLRADSYDVGVLVFPPMLDASLNGETLDPPVTDGNVISFRYPDGELIDITVTVPVGTELIVNGTRVTDVSARTLVPYPGLTKYEAGISDKFTAYSQNLGCFCSEPQILAFYNGDLLSDTDGNYEYLIPSGKAGEECVIFAPAEATVRVNGISLGSDEIVESKIENAVLVGAEEYVSDIRYMTKYSVSGLFYEPDITCTLADGSEIEKDPYRCHGNVTYFHKTPYSDIPEEAKKDLTSIVKTFCKYYTNGLTSLTPNYNASVGRTARNSPAYLKLKADYKKLYKAPSYVNITPTADITFEDFIDYGNGYYSVTGVYSFTAKGSGVVYTFSDHIEILYRLKGTTRSVISFSFIEKEGEPE